MPLKKSPTHDEKYPKNKLDRLLFKLGNTLSLFFLVTVVISFYEIVMRYIFDAPTIWVHETASFIGGCLFVFGGAYALATDKHVRVVLIYDNVSIKTKGYLNIFHHLMGLLFTAMLCFAAYKMASSSWFTPWGTMQPETSGSAWNPAFPAYLKALILLVSGIMFVQFLLHLIRDLYLLRGHNHD